jgi:hypothetical protein
LQASPFLKHQSPCGDAEKQMIDSKVLPLSVEGGNGLTEVHWHIYS